MEKHRYTWNIRTIKIVIITSLLLGALLFFLGFKNSESSLNLSDLSYEIVHRWQLPPELREVSGIEWLENDQMAAIQDEDGILYVYNLEKNKISRRIKFGKPGDYEGLALMDEDAFVLESNGNITEIRNYNNSEREVSCLRTAFSAENNTESLAADKDNSRLLIMTKEFDPDSERTKGIYAISLKKRKFENNPVYKVNMDDEVFKEFKNDNLRKTFRPSDLAIHPVTKEIYILDGKTPKLLILNPEGVAKTVFSLSEADFPQPEGITFGPDGTLYISSEGKKNSSGTISEVRLKH